MPEPNDAQAKNVRSWLDMANKDLGMAESLVESGYPAGACFHAQQAAEKTLKSFLLSHGIAPERTHDLAFLRKQVSEIDPDLAEAIASIDILSTYAVDVRYPGSLPEPTDDEAREAIGVVRALWDHIPI